MQKQLNSFAPRTASFQIAISVDCVIFGFDNNELKVLLIKSDLEEYNELWSLLGDLGTSLMKIDNASYRVLKQRTGLRMMCTWNERCIRFGEVNRHPAGRVITTAYYSLINIKDHQLALEHNELHWHPVNEISNPAFDHKR